MWVAKIVGSTQFHGFSFYVLCYNPFSWMLKLLFSFRIGTSRAIFYMNICFQKKLKRIQQGGIVVENHRVCNWPPKNLPVPQPQRGSLAKAKYLFWRSRRIEPEEARALSEPEDQDRKVTTCDARTWRSDISRLKVNNEQLNIWNSFDVLNFTLQVWIIPHIPFRKHQIRNLSFLTLSGKRCSRALPHHHV